MAKWIKSADNELVNFDQCREVHIVHSDDKFQVRAEGAYFDSEGSAWWILGSFDTQEEAIQYINKLNQDLQGTHVNFSGVTINADDKQKFIEELKKYFERSKCDRVI